MSLKAEKQKRFNENLFLVYNNGLARLSAGHTYFPATLYNKAIMKLFYTV